MQQDPDFAEIVTLICKEDVRFDRKAYDFVRVGLDHTVKELRKKDASRAEKSRHVSGPELLDCLRSIKSNLNVLFMSGYAPAGRYR